MKERRPTTFRAFMREERQFVLLMLGAFALIALMHLVTMPDPTRWHRRTAGEWRVFLSSHIPEVRDSALIAMSVLQPDSESTIRIAAAMLDDPSDFVAESAMETVILAGRHGGGALRHALTFTLATLEATDARGRVRAARVLGAIGAPAVGTLHALVAMSADSRAAVRSAAVAAMGSVLEGHPQSVDTAAIGVAHVHLLAAANDAASDVRDAAIEALFRVMPQDARLRSILVTAQHDSSADVRERAEEILRMLSNHVTPERVRAP